MGLKLTVYRALARLARFIPVGPRRLRESLAGRAGASRRWAAWTGGRTAWFHAASVGEALAAEPVMRRLRAARPDLPIVLTYTSPSLSQWPHPFPADRADFAPAEEPRAMERAFAALNPVLLVFSSADLWPEMLAAAARRGVPVAVAGGAVRPGSRRLSWPARGFLKPLYGTIRFVGARDDAHAARWAALGVPRDAVAVTGDPRHDHVLERVANLAGVKPLVAWATSGPIMVAGSVEPGDVEALLEAFSLARARRPDVRLLVVPHEPSGSVVTRVRRSGIGAAAWSPGDPVPDATTAVVIVQSVGLLPDLYLLGTMAYVGGGHSVLEPAALACPVLEPGPAPVMASRWIDWLENPHSVRADGLIARRGVQPGAARVIAERLDRLIG